MYILIYMCLCVYKHIVCIYVFYMVNIVQLLDVNFFD